MQRSDIQIPASLFPFQDLMEHLEKQDRTIRKLKKQLKVYSKRIGEMGGEAHLRLLSFSVMLVCGAGRDL